MAKAASQKNVVTLFKTTKLDQSARKAHLKAGSAGEKALILTENHAGTAIRDSELGGV